jgi:DNA-binding CsgD family transcriptional regulator
VDAAIADREDLVELHGLLRAGKKPAEIAATMGLDVEDVYVLIRLFRRRTEGISKELFDELAAVARRPEGGAL